MWFSACFRACFRLVFVCIYFIRFVLFEDCLCLRLAIRYCKKKTSINHEASTRGTKAQTRNGQIRSLFCLSHWLWWPSGNKRKQTIQYFGNQEWQSHWIQTQPINKIGRNNRNMNKIGDSRDLHFWTSECFKPCQSKSFEPNQPTVSFSKREPWMMDPCLQVLRLTSQNLPFHHFHVHLAVLCWSFDGSEDSHQPTFLKKPCKKETNTRKHKSKAWNSSRLKATRTS